MEHNDPYIAAIQSVPYIGSITTRRLIQYFKSAKNAWEASIDDLKACGFMRHKCIEQYNSCRRTFSFEKFQKYLDKHNISYITYLDKKFPPQLHNIYNPPVILYYKGLYAISTKCIGIVGARRSTPAGKNNARIFGEELSNSGITVVSGGARGIDSAAHEGALKGTSPTIAVMGCGLDVYYPSENRYLFEQISEKGLLLSEFAPGVQPIGKNFPLRNRIISGLSQGILVVEAKSASGSLITADMALNDGRDVFAIPGNIHMPNYEGTNWLLKQGAIPTTSVDDILNQYGWNLKNNKEKKNSQDNQSMLSLTIEEQNVLSHLSYDIIKDIDTLVIETHLNVHQLGVILLKLELNDLIEQVETGGYLLITRR